MHWSSRRRPTAAGDDVRLDGEDLAADTGEEVLAAEIALLARADLSMRNSSTSFVASVFPAPLSPLMTMAWCLHSLTRSAYARLASANTCGGSTSPLPAAWYLSRIAGV